MSNVVKVSIFALFLFASTAQAAVITFEEYGITNDGPGNGEVIGDEWVADYGVSFSTNGIALNIGSTAGSPPNSLGADASSINDFSGNITIQFTGGNSYTDVMFTIFNTPFQATAYDVNNNLLAILVNGIDFSQYFDFSGYAVNRIEITGSFYAIDDLSFGNVSAVPIPAAAWLFGSGLIGLVRLSRRKKYMAEAVV